MPDPSKTEKATAKKRRDERKKGNVFTSKDVVAVMSVLVVFTVVSIVFPMIVERLSYISNRFFDFASTEIELTQEFISAMTFDIIIVCILILSPIVGTAILTAIVATGIQTRFLFATQALKPKFSKLNPISGFKRMVSLKSVVELVKNLIKIIIIIFVVYNFIMDKVSDFSTTLELEMPQAVRLILTSIMELIYNVCVIFVFIAAADYFYQRWNHENEMKMTKQEVKEEYKQMEGDPKIKGKIKEQQRKIAQSRMMQQVPTSDVVIKNPTHYAVALRYDIEKDRAPIVVAKGQNEIALKIIEIAEEHDVYVMENKELARTIYATAEIDQDIPFELYSAVAEILALVYKIKEKQI